MTVLFNRDLPEYWLSDIHVISIKYLALSDRWAVIRQFFRPPAIEAIGFQIVSVCASEELAKQEMRWAAGEALKQSGEIGTTAGETDLPLST